MRLGSIIMLLVALVFGVTAAFLAKTWLEGQTPEPQLVVKAPQVKMGTLVVASEPLRFGSELSQANLREIDWPAGAVPAGAFARVAEVLDGEDRRVALGPIEINEPVLKTKITGSGQRASLAALLEADLKAVSIRVTDVQGVAGFVLPGERVDVLLTRMETQRSDDGASQERAYTDVLLQNVRVLAVDQLADERAEKPAVAKAVTIEVSIDQAQKLALASTVGQLSLILRSAGSNATAAARRVSLSDLSGAAPSARRQPGGNPLVTIGIVRGLSRSTYTVPPDHQNLIN